jgi:hypothetical protein
MTALKNMLIGAGIVSGWLIVGEIDYRTLQAQEREQLAVAEEACARKGQVMVQDQDGRPMCAPKIFLTMPVQR